MKQSAVPGRNDTAAKPSSHFRHATMSVMICELVCTAVSVVQRAHLCFRYQEYLFFDVTERHSRSLSLCHRLQFRESLGGKFGPDSFSTLQVSEQASICCRLHTRTARDMSAGQTGDVRLAAFVFLRAL